jgi:hypothetical protein
MSEAIQQAIRAMEWMLCDYEHLNTMGEPLAANWPQRVQAVKDAVAKLQAAQAQAGDGEAVIVTDEMALSFHRALTDGAVGSSELEDIKTGLRAALAKANTRPQPQVNQQLPEGCVLMPVTPTEKMISVISNELEVYTSAEELYAALLAAAQEGK